ncbi:MAG: DUF1615 domain-containing protein [Rudaea sp.]
MLAGLLLAGCALSGPQKPKRNAEAIRAQIVRLIPSGATDKQGWAADIDAAFAALDLPATTQNLCAVLSVTEQESGFHVDPVVPDLGRIAQKEIDRRAGERHIPAFVVHTALLLKSPNGKRYSDRLAGARTEKQLSAIFEDFIGVVPLGKRLFGGLNPVHTAGPMQVSIAFAEAHDRNYPYPIEESVRHEVFSRRGGMYFGILHLLGYPTHYPEVLYRFADFNAGWYASRNAAFQQAVNIASGKKLALDGDLIRYDSRDAGATELVVLSLARKLDVSDREIHNALRKGETFDFEATDVYKHVFDLAERVAHKPLPRAVLPGITLESPKITRKLTTAWFAKRVDDRWRTCMQRAR